MERNIFISSLPLTVLCVACGYLILIPPKSKLQTFLNVYSPAVTTLSSVLWITLLFRTIYSTVYSFVSVIELCLIAMSSGVLIYYLVKFYVCQDMNCNILGNINYADRMLETICINVPHTQNRIEGVLFAVGYFTLCAFHTCKKLYSAISERQAFDFIRVLEIVSSVSLEFYIAILFAHCYYVINIVRQRVKLTRHVFETFSKLFDRNFAWNETLTISSIARPATGNCLTQMNDNFKTIVSVYRSIYESFQTSRQLYSMFFTLFIFGLTMFHSKEIINYTAEKNNEFLLYISAAFLVADMIPLCICESIASELNKLGGLLTSFYYEKYMKSLKDTVRLMICEFAHSHKKFDCGFLSVGYTVILHVLDCISLIVFSACARCD